MKKKIIPNSSKLHFIEVFMIFTSSEYEKLNCAKYEILLYFMKSTE